MHHITMVSNDEMWVNEYLNVTESSLIRLSRLMARTATSVYASRDYPGEGYCIVNHRRVCEVGFEVAND